MSARIIPFPERRIVRRFEPLMTKNLMAEIAEIVIAADEEARALRKPKKPRKKTAKAVDCG